MVVGQNVGTCGRKEGGEKAHSCMSGRKRKDEK